MTHRGRAGVALVLMAVAGLVLAGSVGAAVPDVPPHAARKVIVKTTDRRPGGRLEVDVTWSGRGPYSGRVFGSVQDLEADGYCVRMWVWQDGRSQGLNPKACPADDTEFVHFSFRRKWRVLVRVCLESRTQRLYCSAWR